MHKVRRCNELHPIFGNKRKMKRRHGHILWAHKFPNKLDNLNSFFLSEVIQNGANTLQDRRESSSEVRVYGYSGP